MSAREGQQQPGPRRCAGCDHFHGGRAFGVCLMAGCDCIVVQVYAPAVRLAPAPPEPELLDAESLVPVPAPVARAARRPWFYDRYRWFRMEGRGGESINLARGTWSLRRRRL